MKISILIPCRNEELSIAACIRSCISQTVRPSQIVIVNDGSTDGTAAILAKFKKKYPRLITVIDHPGTGQKSYAQQLGLAKITGDICVSTDADSIMQKNFLRYIKEDFQDPTVAAVSGYVKSRRYNWLTASRSFDYVIGQDILKQAQHYLGFILVIPGVAGAFRTEILRKMVIFGHDTLAEDLDITYQLHKKKQKVIFDRRAVSYTQDPANLQSYIYQIKRWYGGGWQNLRKHFDRTLLEHHGRTLELAVLYTEGLVFSVLAFIMPAINFHIALLMYLFVSIIVAFQSVYAFAKDHRWEYLLIPLYYLPLMYINCAVFLEQFVKEFLFKKRNLVWYQPRRIAI